MGLFDRFGNPTQPPVEEFEVSQTRQYISNYQSICVELRNRVMQINGVGNQRRALERFGDFINGSARVLLVRFVLIYLSILNIITLTFSNINLNIHLI
jgi:hypothetical protein